MKQINDQVVRDRLDRLYQRPVRMQVENLQKSFAQGKSQHSVLEQISFSLYRREFLTVVGPSGCGKSTLIRILAGLEQASAGSIQLDGKEVSGPGPERGMVFQGYSLFPWLSVVGNVAFSEVLKGSSRSIAQTKAKEWLAIVGLQSYANYYPHQLSGGMRQRVAIARALAAEPRVLLMDEPFGALDAQTRARMQRYLVEIWSKVDISIIFITHDLDEAMYLGDRVLVLEPNPGRIKEVLEVPLPQPRTEQHLASPAGLEFRAQLESLIHQNSNNEVIAIPKMTMVGDEIL